MTIDEKAMCYLEEHIPELAQAAFTQAYWQALAAGSSVLVCEEGVIYEVFPDGTRSVVKHIQPPRAVIPGTKVTLR